MAACLASNCKSKTASELPRCCSDGTAVHSHTHTHSPLAQVHYHRFSNEASLELYEEALRINAKDGHALVGMGEALERQGGDHFGEALMYYDKAQQVGPRDSLVCLVFGKADTLALDEQIPSVGVKPWICAARVLQKQSKVQAKESLDGWAC